LETVRTLRSVPTVELPLTESPTQVAGRLPLTTDRDRRRAAITAPKLEPGRYLAIEDGDEVVVIPVGENALRLGRAAAADVMLEHLSVSRRHAVVVMRGEDVAILDDRSLNGVLVNGERVREAVLEHGDEVRLGDIAMRYLHVM
jgi:pSer/pThr/pTyr-binding forkhead associated (FHA) protein